MCPPYLLIVDLDVRDLYPGLYIRRAPHHVEQRPGKPTRIDYLQTNQGCESAFCSS